MSNIQRFFVNISAQFGASMGSSVFAFLFTIIAADKLGLEGFGKFSTVQIFVTTFFVFTDLGLTNIIIREVARSESDLSYITENIISLKLILGIIIFVLSGLIAYVLGYQNDTLHLIWLYSLILIPYSLTYACVAIFNGMEKLTYSAIPYFGIIIGYGGGIILIYLGYGLSEIFGIILASSILTTLLCFILLNFRFLEIHTLRFNIHQWWDYLVRGFPYGVMAVTGMLAISFGPIFLSRVSGELQVGYFNTAYKIIAVLMLIVSAYNAAIFPMFNRLESTSKDALYYGYKLSMKFMLIVGLPCVVAITILANKIFELVFPKYLPAATILQILIWYWFFSMLATPVFSILFAEGKQKKAALIFFGASVLSVLFGIILIPPLGSIGIGIALIILTFVQFTFGYREVSLKYQIPFFQILSPALIISFAVLIVGIIMYSFHIILTSIIMGIVIVLGVLLLRIFDPTELSIIAKFPLLSRFVIVKEKMEF